MSYIVDHSSLSASPHYSLSMLQSATNHSAASASSPIASTKSLTGLTSVGPSAAAPSISQLGALPGGSLSINPATGALQWTAQPPSHSASQQQQPLQPLPLSALSSLSPLQQQQLTGSLPNTASLTTLPPLSQLSHAVAALQQQQQQQFAAPLPLGHLNLGSLLLPFSSAGQVQPLSQSSPAAASPLAALTGGGLLALSLPGTESVSNSALLQLQASLLQAAQTGNAAAIQQLQSLNALMQQHSHPPVAQLSVPLSASSTPQQTVQSLFAPVSLAPASHNSPASLNASLDGSSFARGSSVSPPHRLLEQLSRSPQKLKLSPSLGANSGSTGSAFRPRIKRDREDGAGGNGSTSGGVSAKQALKSSHLRADVREAVAANQRDGRVPVVPLGSTSSNTDSGGNNSSPSAHRSGSSGSGSGSGSSDEEQMKQADDESEEERGGEGKKRRRKRPSSANNSGAVAAAKHPFHLFSALDSTAATAPFTHKPPAMPLSDNPTASTDGSTNPLLYLYVPQQATAQAASSPDVSALSSLLAAGGSAAVNGFPAASSSISNNSAALSALSSYLNGAGASGQPAPPLLSGLDSSLQQQLTQQQQQLLQQIQLQQSQQQHPQLRQQSAPSPSLALPPTSSSSTIHGTPLHLVSQHFHDTHGHPLSSDSGSGSGSGSGGGGGHSSHSHGIQHPQSILATSSSSSSGHPTGGKKMRKKHIVTDRQRRAKIKEGMEQLRTLLSSHGSFTTDQVSIMMASVQLIQKLRGELSSVKQSTAQMKSELSSYKQQFGLLPGSSPSNSPSVDANSSSDRLSPLTLLTAATSQAGSNGGVDGEKGDRRSSGGKRSGAHSQLSVDSSPSRSPSLTKPMAAMTMMSSGSGSEDGSRQSSGDDSSPFPPERSDEREADGASSSNSSGSNSQRDDRSITPDSGLDRRSDAGSGTTDNASSQGSTIELAHSEQHSQAAVKVEQREQQQQPSAMLTS